MEIELIDTGFFYADGGAMFGAIPKTSWSKRYPSNDTNGCVLAMRTVLVKTPGGRVILIDTGAGDKQLELLSYYKFYGLTDLAEELQKRGISRNDVTDVILTHLHFDHCGYVTLKNKETGTLELAFPNAKHWLSESQLQNFMHPHPLESASFMRENLDLAIQKGVVQLIQDDTSIYPGIMLKLYNGHSKGQLVPYIRGEKNTYLFAGDVVPLAASVSPHWISAYDTNPMLSYDEKIRMLDYAVKENQVVIFCHDAYTRCATIKKIGNFFKPDEVFDHSKYR